MQSSVGDDDAFYPGEDPNSPEVLRVRQEQAYRSVGALQLRVEELTLEVTKVRKKGRKEGRNIVQVLAAAGRRLLELKSVSSVMNDIRPFSCSRNGTPCS